MVEHARQLPLLQRPETTFACRACCLRLLHRCAEANHMRYLSASDHKRCLGRANFIARHDLACTVCGQQCLVCLQTPIKALVFVVLQVGACIDPREARVLSPLTACCDRMLFEIQTSRMSLSMDLGMPMTEAMTPCASHSR